MKDDLRERERTIEMKLFAVNFMGNLRTAWTVARSISEAEAKVKKALKNSTYSEDEALITGVRMFASQNWPGVFGG